MAHDGKEEDFENFIDFCEQDVKLKEFSSDLRKELVNYFKLILSKQEFIRKLEIYKNRAMNSKIPAVQEKLEEKWLNLLESINKYPPKFQILIHELEYDVKKIRVFGEFTKNDPFKSIKEMCAKDIKDKELLLASVDFEAKHKLTHSVRDINEGLINSFTLYALTSRDVEEIRNDPTYEDFFDDKIIQFIISSCYPECKTLLDFSFKISEELLPSIKDLLLQQFKEIMPDILKKNAQKLNQISDAIIAYRNLDENKSQKVDISPELASKIASPFVNSCLCIATVLYPKIKEAIDFLNQAEVKKVKQEFLEKFDFNVIQEKKAILIFYSLLSLYKDNLLRPLFKAGDVVDEPHFHDKVFSFLRTPFGDDIQDESDVAHGRLDIYAFKTPVELKVEDQIQEINAIYDAHKAQFNNYCYRKQSKLGILYVYDNTAKEDKTPPKKDLQLFQSDGYDCAVIVLRGNLSRPSDSTTKKTNKNIIKKRMKNDQRNKPNSKEKVQSVN